MKHATSKCRPDLARDHRPTSWIPRSRGGWIAALLLLFWLPQATAFVGEDRYYSSKAMDSYADGDYDKAEEYYSKAREGQADSPVIEYNLGTTMLKNDKLSDSIDALNSVYDEEGEGLNAAARYNSGLAHHMLARKALQSASVPTPGQAPGPQPVQPPGMTDTQLSGIQGAVKELEAALVDYRKAILAAPTDTDIKFNYELARRELEQLKQQQQQQQQQNQENQDQQEQEKQQEQQKQQEEQEKNEDQKQQQEQQQNQNQDENKDEKQEPQQQNQSQQDKEKKDQQEQQSDGQNDEQKQEPQPTENDQQKPGEMSPQDVERLLNALPEENRQALQRFLNAKYRQRGDMERDW